METHIYYLISSICYLSIIAFIGFWSHSRQSVIEPHLGGRSMNFWTTALSAHASDMSAWLFLSLPMLIWTQGAQQIWVAIGLWAGMALNWLVVSKRLRVRTSQAHCSTLPAWFHYAFNDHYGVVRLLCALLSSLFLLHYLAAGLIALGLLMEQIFGLDYFIGTLVAMALIAAYTMKGGFNAVAWVDLFQALFLLGVIMLVPFLAWQHIPPHVSILDQAAIKQLSLNPFDVSGTHEKLQALFNALGWGLGYFGMPHVLNKFMGIRSAGELRKSMVVGMTWQLLALIASVAIGVVALGFEGLDLNNPELLFISLVHKITHPAVAGLIFCAIMAANLSTMDSQLLVTASVVEEDLMGSWLTQMSPKQKLLIFRCIILGLALVAWLISSGRSQSIQDAVLYSWSGLGACYGPLVLWSLYAKPSHWISACAALMASSSCVIMWGEWGPIVGHFLSNEALRILPMVPGFFAGILALGLSELIINGRNRLLSNRTRLI